MLPIERNGDRAINSDDVVVPGKVAKHVEEFEEHLKRALELVIVVV